MKPTESRSPDALRGDLEAATSLSQQIQILSQALYEAEVASPEADARTLVAHELGVGFGELPLRPPLTTDQLRAVCRMVDRRCEREPLQHITGTVSFLGLDLRVGPGVFVPRPETELLADTVVRELGGRSRVESAPGLSGRFTVVDLCAGSGALGLAVAANVPHISCLAVELSQEAAGYAQANVLANRWSLQNQQSEYELVTGDATDASLPELARLNGQVDVVVCNPPYVPDGCIPRDPEVRDYDPDLALYGGPDGLDVVRQLVSVSAGLLRPGGRLYMEHSDAQGEAGEGSGLPHLFRNNTARAFSDVLDHADLTGRPRFTSATRAGSHLPE